MEEIGLDFGKLISLSPFSDIHATAASFSYLLSSVGLTWELIEKAESDTSSFFCGFYCHKVRSLKRFRPGMNSDEKGFDIEVTK